MSDLFAAEDPNPRAHARREDPETSHEAAAAVTPDLRELQRRVESYARVQRRAGFTDAQMEEDLGDAGSTLRTRRSELTDRNIILDSGQRRTHGDSSRRRIVWVHREFVDDPPEICEPGRPASPEDKRAGKAMAHEIDGWVRSLRAEGRSMWSDRMAEMAELMRRLSA